MLSRTQLQIRVTYDAPVRAARRVLRVLPLSRAGQIVTRENWRAWPEADLAIEKRDAWRNRRLMLHHHQLCEWNFELDIETRTEPGARLWETEENLGQWKLPSRAVDWNAELMELGRARRGVSPEQRARAFCQLCFESMEYDGHAPAQPVRASAAWLAKRGSCADFAHVFLALCRASGLAARYVAGYNPTEGQLHAWAEVWIEREWHSFDPTHGRAPSPGCVAVGIGRDFYDLAPHVGSFRGAAGAQLWLWCRTEISD